MMGAHQPPPSEGLVLSIVIASVRPGPVILDCLAALEAQERTGVEVLVVDAGEDEILSRVRERFPWVRIVAVAGTPSLPMLRGHGLAASGAPLLAILDPWCIVNDGWIAQVVRTHAARPELVIGGGVNLVASEQSSLRAWATYLFDYWEFVAPFAEGFTTVLPGNNISYKRSALPDAATLREAGFWKAFTNTRLKEAGHRLWASSALTVSIRRRLPLGSFVRTRYHHGRSYAAMRVHGASGLQRLKWAAITPALPLLFFSRQLRGLAAKPRARGWFLACTPVMLAFHLSWSFGELCGYLLGAGASHNAIHS